MYASDRSGNNSGMNSGNRSPDRVTPLPFSNGGGEEYLRLLREAQRESKESSRVVSLAGSRRDSPRSSPKSPPNSPNNEMATDDDFKDIFINYYNTIKEVDPVSGGPRSKGTWDWNSRPDQCPPKWVFVLLFVEEILNFVFAEFGSYRSRRRWLVRKATRFDWPRSARIPSSQRKSFTRCWFPISSRCSSALASGEWLLRLLLVKVRI